jgi:hypothetical protein
MNKIGHYVIRSSCNLFNQILGKLQGQILIFSNFHSFANLGEYETHQSSKLAQGISISQSLTLDTKSREK